MVASSSSDVSTTSIKGSSAGSYIHRLVSSATESERKREKGWVWVKNAVWKKMEETPNHLRTTRPRRQTNSTRLLARDVTAWRFLYTFSSTCAIDCAPCAPMRSKNWRWRNVRQRTTGSFHSPVWLVSGLGGLLLLLPPLLFPRSSSVQVRLCECAKFEECAIFSCIYPAQRYKRSCISEIYELLLFDGVMRVFLERGGILW